MRVLPFRLLGRKFLVGLPAASSRNSQSYVRHQARTTWRTKRLAGVPDLETDLHVELRAEFRQLRVDLGVPVPRNKSLYQMTVK